MATTKEISPDEAKQLILSGKPLNGATVSGVLDLSGHSELKKLPRGVSAYELNASETGLSTLPSDIDVECSIVLQNCENLRSLPENLKTGTLDLRNCSSLTHLPEGLNVWFLDVEGCDSLVDLPEKAKIENGGLNLRGFTTLTKIPRYIKQISTLDISDCDQLHSLPGHLSVGLWIDVGGSGLRALPGHLQNVGLRWRGVIVDERIAFRPETITAKEISNEPNAELRRVKIEQMGFDRYIEAVGAKRINSDTDPGGKRELLMFDEHQAEPIVCLNCFCPSTGRQYFLRVPPTIKTCHAAAAWMAGFDDPKKYKPVIET